MRTPPEDGPDPDASRSVGIPGRSPAFLLSPGLRLFFLRLVIASCGAVTGILIDNIHRDKRSPLCAFGSGIFRGLSLGFGVATLIHQLSTAFGPRIPWPIGADVCLTALETLVFLAAAFYATAGAPNWIDERRQPFFMDIDRWCSKRAQFSLAVVWILSLSLLCLLVLKVIVIFQEKGKPSTRRRLDIACLPVGPWWKYPVYALFGRHSWQQIVPTPRGESTWLAILRGLLTVMSVFTLVGFGFYSAIVKLPSEIGITQYRLRKVGPTTAGVDVRSRWNLLVQSRNPVVNMSSSPIAATYRLGASPPLSCIAVPVPQPQGTYGLDTFQVKCPLDVYYTGTSFDLTVDHTKYEDDQNNNIVAVYIGLTQDVKDVVGSIDPVFLFSGAHLLTVVHRGKHQRLKRGALAKNGFRAMATSNNPNISSLRIVPESFTSDWIVVREYRNNPVLTRLSSLGGLGSFLSTLLVCLLGTSLMQSIMGAKPYSPFGLLHNLRNVQAQMISECEKMYPNLRKDMEKQRKNPGIVAYILDTYVDMEVLGLESEDTSTGTDPAHPDSSSTSPNAYNRDFENSGTADEDRSDGTVEGTVNITSE
ncbi:hypothetical protein NMY22_g4477 [Coprinellus aureogranulatus]|nr:hypothetical protein NMY22_g4477 [Coprinellus aureogranulatus]